MAPEATESATRGQSAQARYNRKTSKQRTLELIKSLEADDDERTEISKKISWILRHGAKKKYVKVDDDGWVKVSDLLRTEILEDISEERLMAVIVNSNAQKLRYKLKDTSEGHFIKAYSKTERKATIGSLPLAAEPEKRSTGTLRPEALPFVSVSAAPSVGALPQVGYPWFGFNPMMPQWPAAYPMAPFMMDAPSLLPPGRYRGRIKSFNVEKGFGFIECPETFAQFNRDVFLHKAQFGEMTVGTEVTFQVETNKQGMPQAKDLAPLGQSVPPASSGKGRGKGKAGRGKGGRAAGKGSGRPERGAKSSNDSSGAAAQAGEEPEKVPAEETKAAAAAATELAVAAPEPAAPPAEPPAGEAAAAEAAAK